MHGLTRNSADFDPLVEHLSGRYRLIVPDQRGRGLSDWDPDPVNYRPDIYAADMFALLDGVGIERRSRRHLHGWLGRNDYGGAATVARGADHPQ
jgi:pimeloyl-ACP methyl ester carboxylesterase